MMAIDLHTHSSYSDGTTSPAGIVTSAVDRGLTALALTDHDTLDGIPEARRAADAAGLPFVPGVELSVGWNARAMHLLAYWVEPGPGPLQDRLAEIQRGRAARNLQIVEALNELGFDITIAEIAGIAGDGVAGRPHFAVALMRRPRMRLPAAEAAALTRRCGGVTSVAHPHTVADDAAGFEAAFSGFAALGITGVECHYVEYAPDRRRRMVAIARSAGLVPTGGSDYHGDNKPGIEVGVGRGDLAVPDEALEELAAARPA
jgi:predicted metal-dependent phosphoesterase TrpH